MEAPAKRAKPSAPSPAAVAPDSEGSSSSGGQDVKVVDVEVPAFPSVLGLPTFCVPFPEPCDRPPRAPPRCRTRRGPRRTPKTRHTLTRTWRRRMPSARPAILLRSKPTARPADAPSPPRPSGRPVHSARARCPHARVPSLRAPLPQDREGGRGGGEEGADGGQAHQHDVQAEGESCAPHPNPPPLVGGRGTTRAVGVPGRLAS